MKEDSSFRGSHIIDWIITSSQFFFSIDVYINLNDSLFQNQIYVKHLYTVKLLNCKILKIFWHVNLVEMNWVPWFTGGCSKSLKLYRFDKFTEQNIPSNLMFRCIYTSPTCSAILSIVSKPPRQILLCRQLLASKRNLQEK